MTPISSGSSGKVRGLLIVLVLLLILIPGYHQLLQKSIRKHPAALQQAVVEHCRWMAGKRLGTVAADEVATLMERCSALRWTAVQAAGGVLDPVFVRVTLDAPVAGVLGSPVLIFKQAAVNPKSLHLASSLTHLMSGQWSFNHFNTYSEDMFSGSF